MLMKRLKYLLIGCCALILAAYAGAAGATSSGGACVVCHTFLGGDLARSVTDWRGSVHEQNEVGCELCHGGDAEVELGTLDRLAGDALAEKQAQAMAPDRGFVARPSGKTLFDLCAGCHDASVARYAGSIMGQAYLDQRGGPSCLACHPAHNNIIPDVPGVCAGCHPETTGFDRIDPMNVTAATLQELSRLRIGLVEQQTLGHRPALLPEVPAELESYQVGLLAFGVVILLLSVAWLLTAVLERSDDDDS